MYTYVRFISNNVIFTGKGHYLVPSEPRESCAHRKFSCDIMILNHAPWEYIIFASTGNI